MGNFRGTSQVCVRPKTTEEMSKVVAYCSDRNLAINPQVRVDRPRSVRSYIVLGTHEVTLGVCRAATRGWLEGLSLYLTK